MIETEWIWRIICLGFLYAGWIFYRILLKNRVRYPKIAENSKINIIMVILYNICCYLAAGLIPESSLREIITLPFNNNWNLWILEIILQIVGVISISIGIYLTVGTLKQRNAIGIQKTPSGLFTSGPYQIARHPIYLGIILLSLGFGLIFLNLDGMMILPLIIIVNLLEGLSEEKFDLKTRFGEDYLKYQNSVPVLGSHLIWLTISLIYISAIMILI